MGGFQRVKPLALRGRAAFVGGLLGAAVLLWQTYGFGRAFFIQWTFFGFLWLIALLDWRDGLIYDRIVAPFGMIGVFLAVLFGTLPLENALFAAVLAGGGLYFLRFASHSGMGGGDVKLAFCLGLWLGSEGVAVALFLAFLSGGILAFCLLLSGRGKRHSRIAFAPFLAFGAMSAALFADSLLAFYWGLLR